MRDVNSSNDDHRPLSNYNSSSKHILDCSDVWCVSVYLMFPISVKLSLLILMCGTLCRHRVLLVLLLM